MIAIFVLYKIASVGSLFIGSEVSNYNYLRKVCTGVTFKTTPESK